MVGRHCGTVSHHGLVTMASTSTVAPSGKRATADGLDSDGQLNSHRDSIRCLVCTSDSLLGLAILDQTWYNMTRGKR